MIALLQPGSFTLDGANTTCPQVTAFAFSPGALAAGASCVYAVDFIPATGGVNAGSLVITDDHLDTSPGATQTINLTGTGLQVLPSSLNSGAVAVPYKVTFSASGGTGPYSYLVVAGALPPGLNLSATGTLSGTPTASGPFNFTLQITDDSSFASVTEAYSLNVNLPAALTSPAASSVLTGSKVTFTWSAATGATSYSFRLGTTVGANNIYGSGATTATTVTVSNLPINGEKIYARLYSNYSSGGTYADYVFTAATPAALTSPAPSSVLTGSKVVFGWSAGTGASSYSFRLGTTVGGNDIYGSGVTTATTVTASNLPLNGETIYARLYSNYSSSGTYADYVFTAASPAALTSPIPSSVLAGPTVTFTWSAPSGATSYILRIGTSEGANDLYASGPITATSATITDLPAHGGSIYARLLTNFGSSQVYTDYVFAAANKAALTEPTPGSVLAGPRITFTWSAGTGGVSGYILRLGTSVGANNLYASGPIAVTSVTCTGLPTNGETIYAWLYTNYTSGAQAYSDYKFTAATGAALNSPTPGAVLAGPKVTFTWSAATGGPTGYMLRLGTSVGAANLYAAGPITGTSATPANLPTNGETIYARLLTNYPSGGQAYVDYTFTAAP